MNEKLWYLYIIETENGKLYTGITTDIERRFSEHAGLKKGAKFTKANPPKRLVYQEKFSNRSEASKREFEIKKLRKSEKIKLFSN